MVFEKFLKKNLDLKIISLTIAAFLWVFVHLTQTASGFGRTEANLRIPLVVENLAPSLRVVESDRTVSILVELDRYASITLKGVHRNIDGLKPSDFKASVDMEGKGPGTYRNLPVHVASPVGTVISETNPSKVEVVVDQEADKTIPVTWEFAGNKNPGKISVIPREVVVKGSKSLVERVVAALIHIPEPESTGNLQEEYSPVAVDILSRPVAGPSVIPQKVRVITKYSELARPVPIRPNIIGKLPVGMELKSVSVSPMVVLADSGSREPAVDHLDTPPIDVTDKQGAIDQTVKLVVPEGVRIHGKGEVQVIILIGKRS